jgi:CRP/FNR family transcriptional regulator
MNIAPKHRVSDQHTIRSDARLASAFANIPTLSRPPAPPPRRDEVAFLDRLWECGKQISLRPQERLLPSIAEEVVVLRDGLLAVDATPAEGKLQVLDFLVPGDIVTAPIIRRVPGLAVRAITSARIILFDGDLLAQNVSPRDYWAFLFARCQHQLVRTSIHRLMIGRLEIEPRVASFILASAYSYGFGRGAEATVSLPMSRADIANYLVINSDTLSRTMMKFAVLGLIERVSRHNIRVLDFDGLRKKSPLAHLLAAAPGDNFG